MIPEFLKIGRSPGGFGRRHAPDSGWPAFIFADVGLDHNILRPANHEKVLAIVPAHKDEVAQFVDFLKLNDAQAIATFSADFATHTAENGDADDDEQYNGDY